MATMPSREATAPRAIASILPQVSVLWLFLDRFDEVPPFARDPRIRVLRSQEHGDLRANGKFLGMGLGPAECVYLSVDDDIEYPPDYGSTLARYLALYSGGVAFGVHASILKPPVRSYREDRIILHRRARQRVPIEVDVIGTDSAAFLPHYLRFDPTLWPHVNMVDLGFALEARRAGVPLLSLPRSGDWVRPLQEAQQDSIYAALLRDDTRQTLLAAELVAMPRPRLPGLPRLVHSLFSAARGIRRRIHGPTA